MTARTSRRRWLLRSMAVAFGLGLLALAELVARLVPAPARDRFVDVGSFTLFTRSTDSEGDWVEITHPYAYPERRVRFLAEKPEDTIRIFVLGASAAAGWPHPPDQTFSSYLERQLQLASRDRRVEVINAAAHGFPSYRVVRILAEVLEFEPDLLIVYCGNNEFLEGRRYADTATSQISGWLSRSRLVQLSRRILPTRPQLEGDELNELAASMWARVQREASILRSDPTQFARVREHYTASLHRMAELARGSEVPLALATVPSNLRDWLPVVSEPPSETVAGPWRVAFDGGRRALLQGIPSTAADELERAVSLAPEHAESWFWLGRALEGSARPDEARAAYRRAKDEDRNPFRTLGSFNEAVRDISSTQAGLLGIDLESDFDQAARGAAPGFDLFLDYVHPTVAGNLLVSDSVARAIAPHLGLATPGPATPPPTYREDQDFRLQMKILGMSLINHQYVSALARAYTLDRLVRSPPANPPNEIPAETPEVVRSAIAMLEPYLELDRRRRRGEEVPESEAAPIEAAHRAFYEEWFRYGTF